MLALQAGKACGKKKRMDYRFRKKLWLKRRVFSILLTVCLLIGMMPFGAMASLAENESVGQLKILARYNDSMQFYDGHVYLLFTSYLDTGKEGVQFYWVYGIYTIDGKRVCAGRMSPYAWAVAKKTLDTGI